MNAAFLTKKSLGQHFLKDASAIEKIIQCQPANADQIIEIGPGMGALTLPLTKLSLPLLLIEKDKRLVEHWKKLDFSCIAADAMELSWSTFLPEHDLEKKNIWLVSNLPYNISAPLTVKLLPCTAIKNMTLMYQKEVAYKILAQEGMNSLHALCSAFFNIKKIALIKPGAFHPPPKVDSCVLQFERKSKPDIAIENFKNFETFLRKLFANPRKQLHTVLSSMLQPDSKEQLTTKLDLKRRAETLIWKELYLLFQLYSS